MTATHACGQVFIVSTVKCKCCEFKKKILNIDLHMLVTEKLIHYLHAYNEICYEICLLLWQPVE